VATYLVTGATGFIGRHFMARLLERQDVDEVYVLVRERSQDRLEGLSQAWREPHRVTPLIGDIAEPLLGLTDAQLGQLSGKIDHVVHIAALYDMTSDDAVNDRINIEGTRQVIEVAARIEAGRLHHVSSVAVAGDYEGVFTEDMFDVGQPLPSPYHRTKFEAERLVREQDALPWRVYRPAVVVGHSKTGEMDKIDGPYYFFPTFARLAALPGVPFGALPNIGNSNIVPVDYVVDAMDHLVHADGLDNRAFHLVSPKPQKFNDVYSAFAKAAGAPRPALSFDSRLARPFVGAAKAVLKVGVVTVTTDLLMDRFGIPPEVIPHLTFTPTFDSQATRQALAGSGIAVPPLDSYAGVLWRYWRENLDRGRARRSVPGRPLAGRTVMITGASSGIGAATALKVAEEGGIPLLVARRTDALEEVKTEIEAAGGTAHVYSCDLTDESSVEKLVTQVMSDHGHVDMLVNSAGRSIRRSVKLSVDRFHDFERAMSINYFGAIRLILVLLPYMTRRRFGHIVNISSIGVQTNPPRFSAYVASKSALDAFTRIVASEVHGYGVTFTTIHMPLVRTPMIAPTKMYDRFPALSPDEAADLVVKALKKRPVDISTRLGTIGAVAYALTPRLVHTILHEAYRVFPDSAAAGGSNDAEKRIQQLGQVADSFKRLLPGVHW
jgi:thioester reductase-like protein/enoyl-[acyl-carrier-protein] reductase (NADH)